MNVKKRYGLLLITAISVLLLAVVALFPGCEKKLTDDEINSAIIGIWQREGVRKSDGTYYNGILLSFSADSKVTEIIYNYNVGISSVIETKYGNYSINGGKIKVQMHNEANYMYMEYNSESDTLMNDVQHYYRIKA